MSRINEIRSEMISELLENPELMLLKKPFLRGAELKESSSDKADSLSRQRASIKKRSYKVITQQEFLDELDPASHTVLYDENVPRICVKAKDDGLVELKYKKMALPYQLNIKDKKVLHLCGNPMDFTLMKQNPTKEETELFANFKQYWEIRNQDGMKTKFVDAQKSMGDAGLLYYMDYKGEIKSRIISYDKGYVICPHNDPNGDRVMESIYYSNEEEKETIDSWDDTYHYRHIRVEDSELIDNESGWKLVLKEAHGFSEIPFISHRGKVAWDKAQSIIEILEVIYNIFTVIQKRHGWGILYIKGKFQASKETIAGSVILNDANPESGGSAEFKTPPNPEQMIEFLKELKYEIQTAGGATFILPQDIKMSGDVSAIAIQLSQSIDNEEALKGVSEWQNVASKMCRLFKEGLAREMVLKGIDEQAITKYQDMIINAKFKVWMPKSDYEYNQMLNSMLTGGLISQKTAIEKNTESKPDEEVRIKAEADAAQLVEQAINSANTDTTNDTDTTSTDDNTDDNAE